jgi:hypothetical protein
MEETHFSLFSGFSHLKALIKIIRIGIGIEIISSCRAS